MNWILTSYFNSVPCPQRNKYWDNDISKLEPLIESFIANNDGNNFLKIFHDCFDDPPYIKNINWIKVEYKSGFAPTVFRWFCYRDYIQRQNKLPKKIFAVDSTDVQMIQNPFPKMQNRFIYSGDEWQWKMGSRWLFKRKKLFYIEDFAQTIMSKYDINMLNAGLCGGDKDIMLHFFEKQCILHQKHSQGVRKSLDMPIYNYNILKNFPNCFMSGFPINTPYKKNIIKQECWWKHK